MKKELLFEIKSQLEDIFGKSLLPDEINRKINILYTLYRKNDFPDSIEYHFNIVISLIRKLNDIIFGLSSISEAMDKNLKAYLLSTARDIFAIMSVMGAKEKNVSGDNFLEEGLALLASQGAEMSLLQSARGQKAVHLEHISYSLANDLWDIFQKNDKISNITFDEVMAISNKIDKILYDLKKAKNPSLYCIGLYNILVYTYIYNLINHIEEILSGI